MATWKEDIVTALNALGGEAKYTDLYPILEKIRLDSANELTPKWKQTVQGTIEENSPDSRKFKSGRTPIFFSVDGLGSGVWGLFPDFIDSEVSHPVLSENEQYEKGIEGIQKETKYLRRSRDPRLVEKRKEVDNFTCQVCGLRRKINGRYIIDVHHLFPLGSVESVTITSINDLVCLCPNCHRIAHTGENEPIPIPELIQLVTKCD